MEMQALASYATITGRLFDLKQLSKEEKNFLHRVGEKYKTNPTWNKFAAWWNFEFSRSGLKAKSAAYRICQDLESRLGIKEEKLSPPDYRDYLADFIEVRFGSRQRFCEATNVDPGHLSRVFAGRADLSLENLQKVIQALHVAIVLQPEETVREHARAERAADSLVFACR